MGILKRIIVLDFPKIKLSSFSLHITYQNSYQYYVFSLIQINVVLLFNLRWGDIS